MKAKRASTAATVAVGDTRSLRASTTRWCQTALAATRVADSTTSRPRPARRSAAPTSPSSSRHAGGAQRPSNTASRPTSTAAVTVAVRAARSAGSRGPADRVIASTAVRTRSERRARAATARRRSSAGGVVRVVRAAVMPVPPAVVGAGRERGRGAGWTPLSAPPPAGSD
ncbi:hypothetical protein [Actinokineospora spheciospongiae]|uniref:hypothetical protein n=1 Tax=Actinokineospora spheciospongiae TaxID=909613 RepID=UPI0011B5DC37|nr:hypothetical protein [Actinokineospora spheciospongiae]